MELTVHASGPAGPDEVWERYADVRRWSSWSPQVQGVEAGADRIGPGLRGSVLGPLGVKLPFVVLSVDEDARRWSWRVGPERASLELDHRVDPDGPTGTRTALVLRAPAWLAPVALGYAPVAQLALSRLVRD